MRQVRRWMRRARGAILQLFEPFYAQELVSRESIGVFTAVLQGGFVIEVRCDRLVFCEAGHYDQDLDCYYVYRLYSICDSTAPEKLKKACELEIQYPVGYLNSTDPRPLFDIMTSQYLNLLNQRLMAT